MPSVIMLGVVAPLKLHSIFKFQFVSNLLPLKHLLEHIGDFEADSKLVERRRLSLKTAHYSQQTYEWAQKYSLLHSAWLEWLAKDTL